MIQIVDNYPIVPADDFYIRQNIESELVMYSLEQGIIKKYQTNPNIGDWSPIWFDEQELNILEKDILAIEGDCMDEVEVLMMSKKEEMRMTKMPDDVLQGGNSTAHRLYWALDTKKMYYNVSDTWVFCGTLKHDLMDDIGTLTHAEIEVALKNPMVPFVSTLPPVTTADNGRTLIYRDTNGTYQATVVDGFWWGVPMVRLTQ